MVVFWVINMIKLIPFIALGIATKHTAWADLFLAPFAVFGAWLGIKAHHRVPERVYFGITYVLLLITGTKLIWDALT